MLLFGTEEHVDRWCASRRMSRGALLTTHQCWSLAIEWYKNKLRPEWRRHTLEESETVFESLGLTGPFWNLRQD